jgi:hypothetical protein
MWYIGFTLYKQVYKFAMIPALNKLLLIGIQVQAGYLPSLALWWGGG